MEWDVRGRARQVYESCPSGVGGFSGLLDANYAIVDVFTHKGPSDKGKKQTMYTSTTLKEQIQALTNSLADTALSAAQSRHQSQAGEAHLLYALYRNNGLVGSMLRGHGLESSEIRLLMSDIPNRPLKTGEDPVLSASSRRILHDAHDAVEVLRHVQRDSHVELLLRAHGIELPEHQPTREQVEAASRTGVNLAQTVSPNRGRQVGVDYLSYTRLMLEAALN